MINIVKKQWIIVITIGLIYLLATWKYLSLGAIPEATYGHDVSLMFDEAWRIANNQIPHQDFHITVGSGYTYLSAFFIIINHYDAIAFSWMNAAVTTLCFCILVLLLHRDIAEAQTNKRLLTIGLVFAFNLAFGIGSYCLGVERSLTYAMLYNRYGYALLLILFTAYFLKSESNSILVTIICGFCLCALLLLKLPFFFAGVVLVAASFLNHRSLPNLLGVILAGSIFLCVYLKLTSINIFDEIKDVMVIASVRSESGIFSLSYLGAKIQLVPFWPVKTIISLGIVILFTQERMYFQAFLSLLLIACAAWLYLTTWCFTDIPLFTLLALQVLDKLPTKRMVPLVILMLTFVYDANFLSKNILGFERAVFLSAKKDTIPEMNSGHIKHFYVTNSKYIEMLKEAESLIKTHISSPERIATLSFDNPFNAIFSSTSPRYIPICWQYANGFNMKNFPPYRETFSDIKFLLISKIPDPENVTPLQKIYGNEIRQDFVTVAESPHWILMQRL